MEIVKNDNLGIVATDGELIFRYDKIYRFFDIFRIEDGFTITSNVVRQGAHEIILEAISNGKFMFRNWIKAIINCNKGIFTDKDMVLRSYPQLIDIGVKGSCDHGLSGKCIAGKVQCYQNGKNIKKPDMSIDMFKKIIDESEGHVFQVALGGRGDVNTWEHFEEALEYCREKNIVPNYTTSGLDLTNEQIELTKKYCGSVAVSWYRQDHTLNAIYGLLMNKCQTNIHYVLSNETIDEAIWQLKHANLEIFGVGEYPQFPHGIYAVIFLLHKPVGLGEECNMLSLDDPKVKEFFALVDKGGYPFQIGFDSCTIPGIINSCTNIDPSSCDTCEGSRQSMYINAEGIAVCCSFDQDLTTGVNLNNHTITEAWNSEPFNIFRNKLLNSCPKCDVKDQCMGGCPIVNNIVLCNREEKDND